MDAGEFAGLLKAVGAASFSKEKLSVIELAAQSHMFRRHRQRLHPLIPPDRLLGGRGNYAFGSVFGAQVPGLVFVLWAVSP